MRDFRLVALILAAAAAGALVLLVLTLTAGAANTPQDTVQRFLQPRNIRDACAQFAPDSRLNSCIVSEVRTPPATHLVFSHVAIKGNHAAVQADFMVRSHSYHAQFRLVKLHGVWLITFDR
jgi:Flp pilus assembly protein CpaB